MSKNTGKKRIAVIAGDGIGKEVMPEGIRVMEAAAVKYGIDLQFDHFDFSSWDYFEKHGKMLPDNWKDQIGGHDAIYFGAVGWPDKIADHVSLWGSLLLFRREFDQYINLRPARLMPGIIAPVVRRDGSPREPGEIDLYIVRENTEGEYSSIGGAFPGTDREFVLQESVITRVGVDRVLKFAFELAQSRPKKHLTSATKSNGISISMPYWDERVAEMAKNYPGIQLDKFHIDILTAHFVQRPISSTWWWPATCSATSSATWARPAPAPSASRPAPTSIPRAQIPLAVRAGARFGPRHRGPQHRQSHRPDMVRCNDAGVSGTQGRARRHPRRDRKSA
jgi:tartrate dehydrogenase/decarboxylase/D-malate dehydrogenase